jgi:hypothetical protein
MNTRGRARTCRYWRENFDTSFKDREREECVMCYV